jgi:hypothetical protein
MADKIRALFTFEILGKPPEHIKKTLEDLIEKLNELPGISVDRSEVHEPKQIESKDKPELKGIFSSFAEAEILGDELSNIITVVMHAFPSHVEILEPSELKFKNFDISSMLSELLIKMHRYDEIAKGLTMERNVLMNKLKEAEEKLKGFVEVSSESKDSENAADKK